MKYLLVLIVTCLAPATFANDALQPAFDALEARDFETAITSLESLAQDNPDRVVLFHLARVHYRAGEYEEADDTLDELLEKYPDHADAHYLSGLINLSLVGEVSIFRKVGKAKQALKAWETAVATDPNHLEARYAIFAYYANAPSIAGGDLHTARKMQIELNDLNPGYGAMAEGLLASREENYDLAEASFQQAVSLLNRAGPHFSLAQHYIQTEQYEKAISETNQYVAKEKRWWDPDITFVHLILARANAGLGNVEQAKKEIDTALRLKPNRQIKGFLEDTLKEL